MIQMLRKEACSGSIDDLAHIRTEHCLSDCLTKHSAKPDNLISAITTGVLPEVDKHPSFRSLIQHRAFVTEWLCENIRNPLSICSFLGEPLAQSIHKTRLCGNTPTRDFWKKTGKHLIRVHVQPRRSLFVPTSNCPIPSNSLQPDRHTYVCTGETWSELCDVWNSHQSSRCLDASWTGETWFVVS